RPLLIGKIPTPHTVIITARGMDWNPDLKHALEGQDSPLSLGPSAWASFRGALNSIQPFKPG
ncbi:hypothetical protein AB0L67_38635, partial [Streptomyces flaveolus]|uniref:hypothetical protein n=1 Tax=Streptomyces flaveolus TaxID=67297 RepID=UPI00342F4434